MLTLLSQPHRDLLNFTKDLDDLFRAPNVRTGALSFVPPVEVEELEDKFVLQADLPGIDENNLEINVDEGTLTLSGERSAGEAQEGKHYVFRERRFGKFTRSFRLGNAVDETKIVATFDRGVLTIEIPKREEAQKRRIPITVH